jgi:hypothetical protein
MPMAWHAFGMRLALGLSARISGGFLLKGSSGVQQELMLPEDDFELAGSNSPSPLCQRKLPFLEPLSAFG